MKQLRSAMCIFLLLSLCCCSSIRSQSADKALKDPFAYCAATGNMDIPSAPYSGPAMPPAVIDGLRSALKTGEVPDSVMAGGSFWRCMEGKVYACFTGANIPCMAKADTSKTPDVAMLNFCTENPESEFIPAVVTGRFTVYQWRCRKGLPEAGKQVLTPDARGFISEYWYEIKPGRNKR